VPGLRFSNINQQEGELNLADQIPNPTG